MDFPKRSIQNLRGSSGQSYFQFFVENELGWVYHSVEQRNDFGIDGYVEIVNEGNATGKLFGVQIKHGDSYFTSKTKIGYIFFGENKHLNYYLNNRCPIIFIILDGKYERCLWQLFDLEFTSPSINGWTVEIPSRNRLDKSVVDIWPTFVGPVLDYEKEIRRNWELDKLITNSDILFLSIPKSEVESCSFDTISKFINRISKNEKMKLRLHSRIELYFPDYQKDDRELFEIPEVLIWFRRAISEKVPFAYFLNYSIKSYSLFLICYSLNTPSLKSIEKNPNKIQIEYSSKVVLNILETLWENLNNYCDDNLIPEEINKEISDGLFRFYMKEFKLEIPNSNISET